MKVVVDREVCEGHSKCAVAAPEVFEFRSEEDRSYVKLDSIPVELEGKVERAIRLCPRQAIRKL